MRSRDGHIRVLPLHVANKIAAGEVVERPASVVKELVENALDADAKTIRISITQGGRKLVSVQDDGCGMTRDDALLSLERQATSKIMDVNDIEEIDTLGFRGEAIPSIASVSRFSITTRRHDADEGTHIEVNAGTLADVRPAGCPPGTLVEVRDLFCNVPARRKFLRAYATEEAHVKNIFTVHALAHPGVAFSLAVDGRELYRLAPAKSPMDRIMEIFGADFAHSLLELDHIGERVTVSGYIEKPNLAFPSRREQYIFINGRPATAPAVAGAIREAYPRKQGDTRPAAIIFISLSPKDLDVNVHPTKREVRFRNSSSVRLALAEAISKAVLRGPATGGTAEIVQPTQEQQATDADGTAQKPQFIQPEQMPQSTCDAQTVQAPARHDSASLCGMAAKPASPAPAQIPAPPPRPAGIDLRKEPVCPSPVERSLPLAAAAGSTAKPWVWYKYLATTETGYIILETDSGLVTINPKAANERIAFEKLARHDYGKPASQALLIPEVVHLSPADFNRISSAMDDITAMGFSLEPFGNDSFKIDAVPTIIGSIPCSGILSTIASDLASGDSRQRAGLRWREDIIAKSVAKSFAGTLAMQYSQEQASALVEQLTRCRMPYVSPVGKSVMIFTSFRELDRKFGKC